MFRLLSVIAVLALALAWPVAARAQDVMDCKMFSALSELPVIQEAVANKPGVTHTLFKGSVRIQCDDTFLFADEVEMTSDDDFVHARGHVFLQQPTLGMFADHADFNRKTHMGIFYDARGSLQLAAGKAESSMFGALEPDVYFWGERVEKVAARTYQLTHGGFTTCVQPTPRWEMSSSEGTLTLDEHALLRNVVFRVKGVPVFYLPILYYPISKQGRSTGFLMPSYGSSTIRGFTLSNAFFWAISRSQDATFYHDYYAKTGQGVGGEFRYIEAPGSQGQIKLYMLNERDTLSADGTTVDRPAHRSYQLNGNATQNLPHGFIFMGRADYFTDASTQQLYQQNVYDASQRNRTFGGSLTGGFSRYRLGVNVEQTDVYYGLTSAQRYGRAPVFTVSANEKPIGHSKIYFGATSEFGYFVRQDDLSLPSTNRSLWRVDMSPTIRMPISTLSFLSVTTSAALRYTYWSESIDTATATQVQTPLTRELADIQVHIVGPSFSKIFQTPNSGYAERFKHLIEPTMNIRWLSPFSKFSSVASAASDSTDTLFGGVTQFDYGVTNHILAKRKGAQGQGPSVIREIVSIDIGQTYYTDAAAAQYDQQNQSNISTTPAIFSSPFSPIRMTVSARPFDPVIGTFGLNYDAHFNAVRTLNASTTVSSPGLRLTAGWSKTEYIPGYNTIDSASSALNATATIEGPDKHVGGTFSFNYDVRLKTFLNQRVVVYYNTQCCGVSLDYQTSNFASSTLRADHRFGISFTLAGIGSFSNPMGSFGNNSGIR